MRTPLGLTLLALLAACDSPPFCMSSVCGCEGGEIDATSSVYIDGPTWDTYLEDSPDADDACIRACTEMGGFETVDACLDEVGHAALAHDIDAWVAPLLTAKERARVLQARRRALHRLQANSRLVHPASARALGVPDTAAAHRLASAFAAWGGAVAG